VNGREARKEALQRVITIAADIIAAERHIADDPRAAGLLPKLETALELACRDLVNAVDDLPPVERPKGWATTPDGELA
jgi:hypothetical protein